MNTTNIQASDFGKKSYAKPQMKVRKFETVTILAGSGSTKKSTQQNEEYETGNTDGWF